MLEKELIVGIDFDNTIVCYDDIFHQVARERDLIPADTPKDKDSVRNYLRIMGQEDLWTEMQGYVYGARMSDASAFPGALDCISKLRTNGITVFIISHKTRHPYRGVAYDLHNAAIEWMKANGIFHLGISLENVFLQVTKQEKILRIGSCGCTHFIDDLPEFLAEQEFPLLTQKMLFSPTRPVSSSLSSEMISFKSWFEIAEFFLTQ